MNWFGIGLRERRGLPDREFAGSVASEGAKSGDEAPGSAVQGVSNVPRFRRWDAQQEGPLKGFGSQPGRF